MDPVLRALKNCYVEGKLTLEEFEHRVALHMDQCEVHDRVRTTAYGTRYTTCPDFPNVCAEYPARCRGDAQQPGTAAFRKIADGPGR